MTNFAPCGPIFKIRNSKLVYSKSYNQITDYIFLIMSTFRLLLCYFVHFYTQRSRILKNQHCCPTVHWFDFFRFCLFWPPLKHFCWWHDTALYTKTVLQVFNFLKISKIIIFLESSNQTQEPHWFDFFRFSDFQIFKLNTCKTVFV